MDQEMTSVCFPMPYGESECNWDYYMRREKQMIIPGLYLGPYASAVKSSKQQLIDEGITHIVCIRDVSESKFIKPNFPELFHYLVLDIADSINQNVIPYFIQVKEFIDKCLADNGKALVHGNAGISRSACLVASYIMSTNGLSAIDALKLIQSKRFCIHPNDGFRRQLAEYEPIIKAHYLVSEDRANESFKRTLVDDDFDEPIEIA